MYVMIYHMWSVYDWCTFIYRPEHKTKNVCLGKHCSSQFSLLPRNDVETTVIQLMWTLCDIIP